MPQYGDARRDLEERLHRLTNRAGKIEGDLRRKPSADSEDRAAELENDEVLQQLGQDTLAEVTQINAALARIEAGTYGTCANCGGEIGATRLAAMPDATSCLTCAA
jgi:RNA polymerase-binding transcription factor DksA